MQYHLSKLPISNTNLIYFSYWLFNGLSYPLIKRYWDYPNNTVTRNQLLCDRYVTSVSIVTQTSLTFHMDVTWCGKWVIVTSMWCWYGPFCTDAQMTQKLVTLTLQWSTWLQWNHKMTIAWVSQYIELKVLSILWLWHLLRQIEELFY